MSYEDIAMLVQVGIATEEQADELADLKAGRELDAEMGDQAPDWRQYLARLRT